MGESLLSTSRLNTLRCLHLTPINPVICGEADPPNGGGLLILRFASHLRCIQCLSNGDLATRQCPFETTGTPGISSSRSSRTVEDPSSKVQSPAQDRVRTVSRRSEPSSRTALMGEQPNPWNRLQLQDAMSRHRGAEPRRRYELSGVTSLLSPG